MDQSGSPHSGRLNPEKIEGAHVQGAQAPEYRAWDPKTSGCRAARPEPVGQSEEELPRPERQGLLLQAGEEQTLFCKDRAGPHREDASGLKTLLFLPTSALFPGPFIPRLMRRELEPEAGACEATEKGPGWDR